MYDLLSEIQIEMQKSPDMKVQGDIAYFMRKINEHNEEVGKALRRIETTAEKLCCLLWSQAGDAEAIRTKYCTISPSVSLAFNIPHHKKSPEDYAKLMEWLGVPEEQWKGEEPTVSLRWKGIIERVKEAGREGKPLPAGIDVSKQHSIYTLRIRKVLEITEDPKDDDSDSPF